MDDSRLNFVKKMRTADWLRGKPAGAFNGKSVQEVMEDAAIATGVKMSRSAFDTLCSDLKLEWDRPKSHAPLSQVFRRLDALEVAFNTLCDAVGEPSLKQPSQDDGDG